jgi:uncharacterized protein (DUF433 family)
MSDLIEINPRKLGGKPVFRGTRIPISYLSQYLNEGRSVQDFIDDFDIDPTLVRKVYQEEFEDDAESGEKRAA